MSETHKLTYKLVIPARYASTRLPGKPLLDIAGKPLVQHVIEAAQRANAEQIVLATDDARIAEVGERAGVQVVMTSPDHATGTDRLAEVVQHMGWADETLVVNLQGDEPLIPASLLDRLAANLLQYPQAGIATLCTPIHTRAICLTRMWSKWCVIAAGLPCISAARRFPGSVTVLGWRRARRSIMGTNMASVT